MFYIYTVLLHTTNMQENINKTDNKTRKTKKQMKNQHTISEKQSNKVK